MFANGLLRFVSYFQGVQYFLRIDSTTQARYTECQNILDDFLIVDQSISRCKLQLTLFLNLCAEIRVPIVTEKIEGPCHILNSAGIELDCMTSSPSFQSIVNIGFYQVIQRKLKL